MLMNGIRTQEQGFTLIELIIVLVITGILASVGYPYYTRYLTDAEAKGAEAVIGGMAAAMKAARQSATSYATVTLSPAAGSWVNIGTGTANGAGIYLLGTVQIDTGEGDSFEYSIGGLGVNTFQITARGIGNGLDNADQLSYSYNATTNPRVTWTSAGSVNDPDG